MKPSFKQQNRNNNNEPKIKKRITIIIIGLVFLTTMMFVGTPFEFLDSTVDTIATSLIIFLILLLFVFLFRQIWLLDNKIIKWTTTGLLSILAFPYLIVGVLTILLTWSSDHPMWEDSTIYTNDKNEKVISEWREISGSIHDTRYRKIIADFGKFRISFDYNRKNLNGVWTTYDVYKKETTTINFDSNK